MYDVFISYRHVDIEAVRALAAALRAQGLEVWQDEKRIEDFASIQRSVEEGLAHSKALVAWYSARYPESVACQWELTHAFVGGQQEGDPRQRMLLVNPEAANGHIHPIELRDALYRGVTDASGLQATAEAVARHVRKLTGTFESIEPGVKPRWFGAVHGDGSNRFVGRMAELWAIHSGLWSAQVPIITGRESRPLVRVTGMGGSGKSLAVENYAIRFGAAYPGGIFWLRAFGHDAERPLDGDARAALLESQLIDIAQGLGVGTQGLNPAQIRAQVTQRIDAAGPYLWVVDDLPSGMSWDEAQPWLAPSAQGRSVIATRSEGLGWAGTAVAIGELGEAAALELLFHARKPADEGERAEAREIVRALGYHPLAIELAAVAVQKRGFAQFRESLQAPSRDVLDFAAQLLTAQGQALPHREKANLNLSTTLFQSIDGLQEAAKDFLRLAAQVAAVPIGRRLAINALAAAGDADGTDAEDAADIAVASVMSQSLAREPSPGNYLVHTMVVRAMRFRDANENRGARLHDAAVFVLNRMLSDDRIFDLRSHAELRDTIAHTGAVLAANLAKPGSLPVREAQLLDSFYIYEMVRGNYREARRLAERLIEHGRKADGEEHSYTLTFWGYLGRVRREQGDFAGALEIHQRMSGIYRRTVGERHPDFIRSESDSALALYALGQLGKAREVQEKVLELRREVLGDRHADTATAMNNLGITLAALGELDRSRELLEGALKLRTELFGARHPETLQAMSNLAETMRLQGALPSNLQEKVFAARTGSTDEEHPDDLTAMNNLAAARASQGDWEAAREMFARVLDGRARQLGAEHPLTLATMNNLAVALIQLQRFAESAELLERSLELCRRVLGAPHPETLKAAYHLTVALSRANDSSGRVREVLEHDLSALLESDSASLPADMREVQAKLAPLLRSVAARAPESGHKPWWRKVF
jgi:tetratricopeptide (TPR) repeat protein